MQDSMTQQDQVVPQQRRGEDRSFAERVAAELRAAFDRSGCTTDDLAQHLMRAPDETASILYAVTPPTIDDLEYGCEFFRISMVELVERAWAMAK